jgi:predicted nuclease of restriction endonuclease-like RecB superfamily
MTDCWTVRDRNGELLPQFACPSPLEVARKVVPGRYDAFRLHVSSSYRQLFDRAVKQTLEREDWQIVRIEVRAKDHSTTNETIEVRPS